MAASVRPRSESSGSFKVYSAQGGGRGGSGCDVCVEHSDKQRGTGACCEGSVVGGDQLTTLCVRGPFDACGGLGVG